jgi:hypothetical protein
VTASGEFPTGVREIIRYRSRGKCERGCDRLSVQMHHRTPRQSGKHHPPWMSEPSNGLDLCLECHDWIEHNRAAARDLGLLVPRGVAEQAGGNSGQPFTDLAGRRWTLTDDGEKLPGNRLTGV